MKKYFVGIGFWGRLFVFLTLSVFLMLGAVIMGDLLAYFIFGREAILRSDVSVLLFSQSLLSVGIFLLPPVFMVKLCCEGSLWDNIMVSRRPDVLPLVICLGAIFVSEPLVSWLEEVNLRMELPESMSAIEDWMRASEDNAARLLKKLTASTDVLHCVLNIIVLAVLPAVCEEMYFRVGMQTRLFADKSRIRGYYAVVLTAILFSALHMQFFGFLPRMVLGAVLGVMLLITGNVWYSIAAHFFNNMLAVAASFAQARGVEMELPAWMGTWWMALLSAVASVLLLILLHKVEKNSKKTL